VKFKEDSTILRRQAQTSLSGESIVQARARGLAEDLGARVGLGIKTIKSTSAYQRASRANVEKVYAQLLKNKKLNPKCEVAPFKQLTLAMIENSLVEVQNKAYFAKKKNFLIKQYLAESGFAFGAGKVVCHSASSGIAWPHCGKTAKPNRSANTSKRAWAIAIPYRRF
jgi:hypothetical protein